MEWSKVAKVNKQTVKFLNREVKLPRLLKNIIIFFFGLLLLTSLLFAALIAILFYWLSPSVRSDKVIGKAYSEDRRYVIELHEQDWGGSWARCTESGCGGIHTNLYLIDTWSILNRKKQIQSKWPAPCSFIDSRCPPWKVFTFKDGNITWYDKTEPVEYEN